MPNEKPYVAVAVACEKVQEEKDNVMTIVRVVDRILLTLPAHGMPDTIQEPGALVPKFGVPGVPFSLAIFLRPEGMRGIHQVTLQMVAPSGKAKSVKEWPVNTDEMAGGINFNIGIVLAATEGYGTYAFNVLWNGDFLTKIPVTLSPTPADAPLASPPNAPPDAAR